MMMTASEMIPAVGAEVVIRFELVAIRCLVVDVKNVYGRVRLLVSPVCGEGQQWIELSRVVPMSTKAVATRIG